MEKTFSPGEKAKPRSPGNGKSALLSSEMAMKLPARQQGREANHAFFDKT